MMSNTTTKLTGFAYENGQLFGVVEVMAPFALGGEQQAVTEVRRVPLRAPGPRIERYTKNLVALIEGALDVTQRSDNTEELAGIVPQVPHILLKDADGDPMDPDNWKVERAVLGGK